MSTNIIVIASDHAGYNLKQIIIEYFKQKKISVKDLGTNNNFTPVDYPDYAKKVANYITEDLATAGILICGTGSGMAITANRSTNIRAAVCLNIYMAEQARAHNNANILVLGSKLTDPETSLTIVEKFFNTKFEGGRHLVRLNKI